MESFVFYDRVKMFQQIVLETFQNTERLLQNNIPFENIIYRGIKSEWYDGMENEIPKPNPSSADCRGPCRVSVSCA